VVVTLAIVAAKPVVKEPGFTVTALGTFTAALLLASVTYVFVVVFAVKYTEQGSVPAELYDLLPHETRLRLAAAADDTPIVVEMKAMISKNFPKWVRKAK
jgi:hypothetical protein